MTVYLLTYLLTVGLAFYQISKPTSAGSTERNSILMLCAECIKSKLDKASGYIGTT